MPLPDGITTRYNEKMSWLCRRNYTWSYNTKSDKAENWGGATDKAFTGKNKDNPKNSTGWSSVLCTMNIFGQDNIYRFKKPTFNAYCVVYIPKSYYGLPNTYGIAKCGVTYPAANNTSDPPSPGRRLG